MGRLQRMYSESGIYFVTARAFQSRFLLTPSPAVNRALGGVLAMAVKLTGVKLHGYVVASNHIHLLVTSQGASLSRFMQYFLGNAARKLGRLTGWSGSLWQRRFSAEPVLDDEAALGRLRYILAHGVKEGLVKHPAQWPGLSCLKLLREGGVEWHRFFHWSRRWKKGALIKGAENAWDDRWAEEISLELAPLPGWAALSQSERRDRVDRLVCEIVEEAAKTSTQEVKGAEAVIQEDPRHRPARSKKSPRPLCHTTSIEKRKAFVETLRAWVTAFVEASKRFRSGEWAVEFPPWSFRPSVQYDVCGT